MFEDFENIVNILPSKHFGLFSEWNMIILDLVLAGTSIR
jgi:hypothetical protein